MKLSELKVGQKARIVSVNIKGTLKRRLNDMGILTGEVLKVEKVAPLGDPIDVVVKNYHLSIRKAEAGGIEVEVIE